VAWTRIFYAVAQQYQDECCWRQEEEEQNGNNHIRRRCRRRRIILTSSIEYASNVVAMTDWANRQHNNNWHVLCIPPQSGTSTIDLTVLDDMLNGRYQCQLPVQQQQQPAADNNDSIIHNNTNDLLPSHLLELQTLDPNDICMVCVTHIPTNSGVMNPLEAIGERIQAFNQRKMQQQQSSSL
jgi:hypothetical protein